MQVLLEPWLTWILGLLQAHGDSQTRVQLFVNPHLLQGQPPSAPAMLEGLGKVGKEGNPLRKWGSVLAWSWNEELCVWLRDLVISLKLVLLFKDSAAAVKQ